jgi:GWxTD domain-containing protein
MKFNNICLRIIAIFTIAFQIQAADGWIKNELKSKSPLLFVDVWSGQERTGQQGISEFFVEMSPADMVFVVHKSDFIACYQVNVAILDEQDEQVAEQILRDTMRVESYAETMNYGQSRLYKFTFNLAGGNYRAQIHLIDCSTYREAVLQQTFEVRYHTTLPFSVSDILMARKEQIERADKRSSKGILPFPAKIYGVDQSKLFCSFEIYQTNSQKRDSIEYTISYIDPGNKEHLLNKKRVHYQAAIIPVLYSFDTGNLPPGAYKLILRVAPGDERYQIERKKKFLVYQNPVDIRFFSYSDILEEIKLIAEAEEVNALKKLPEGVRQQGLYNFWKKRDPTPGTAHNELMAEFYKRVNFARQFYSYDGASRGTYSDQGKVYILLGVPDRISRQISPAGIGYVEIWNYQNNLMQVIFQDDRGFGNYRLISPFELLGR